jgi:hypothetical protein
MGGALIRAEFRLYDGSPTGGEKTIVVTSLGQRILVDHVVDRKMHGCCGYEWWDSDMPVHVVPAIFSISIVQ